MTSGDTANPEVSGMWTRRARTDALYEFVPHLLWQKQGTHDARLILFQEGATQHRYSHRVGQLVVGVGAEVRWRAGAMFRGEGCVAHFAAILLTPGEDPALPIAPTHESFDLLAIQTPRPRSIGRSVA